MNYFFKKSIKIDFSYITAHVFRFYTFLKNLMYYFQYFYAFSKG